VHDHVHGVVPPGHRVEQVQPVAEQVDQDRCRAEHVRRPAERDRTPSGQQPPGQRQGDQGNRIGDGPYGEALALQTAQVGHRDGEEQHQQGGDLDRGGQNDQVATRHTSSVASDPGAGRQPGA